MGEERPNRVSSVPEKRLRETIDDWEKRESLRDRRVIFITNKRKVVAHAEWKDGDIVVTKVRRPAKTKLQVGEVLYKEYRPPELPPRPEIKTDGWQLIRYQAYDSSRSKRQDPFWTDHEGWFVIPKTIGDKNGIELFLNDYPEMHEEDNEPKYTVGETDGTDTSEWKMAPFAEVDAYVCGNTDVLPTLRPFRPPTTSDMVSCRASLCFCGCGNFEGWHRYWENKWIVYVPRKQKI